jgi:uncharacterized membrane protein YraQ (UPF0718 family)
MLMRKSALPALLMITAFLVFLGISSLTGFTPGLEIRKNFFTFVIDMLLILPCAFLLIGLFETWVKKETVEKHLGWEAGFMSYIWALILGGCTLGPMIVALPAASALYHKGAKLSVVFTYLGAAAICRVPMTIFEASFLGAAFTLVRYLVSLPLVVFSSMLLGSYLEKRNFTLRNGK